MNAFYYGGWLLAGFTALWVSLTIRKHGVPHLLRVIGAAIFASSYAWERGMFLVRYTAADIRDTWRRWYEHKMAEHARQEQAA